MERRVTPEDVKWAYRLLLGREPESYDILINTVAENISQRALVVRMLESDEFGIRFPSFRDRAGDE